MTILSALLMTITLWTPHLAVLICVTVNFSSLTCFNWSWPAIYRLFYHNFKHLPLTQCSITDHNCIIELPKCTWSWCCQPTVGNSCILAMHMMKPEITATEHQYKYYRNLHKVPWGFTSTLSQPKYSQQSEWLWDRFPNKSSIIFFTITVFWSDLEAT